jgi:plasmid replication initiation protein
MENKKIDKVVNAMVAVTNSPFKLVKSNPIINARYDLSTIQVKILLHMISKIDHTKDRLDTITISVQDFKKITGISTTAIYSRINIELDNFLRKTIYNRFDGGLINTTIIAGYTYNNGLGKFNIDFSPTLTPYLLQLKSNFTVIDIRSLLQLKSIYAIRFYEFCKESERLGIFKFEVEKLKDILGLSDRYTKYTDFRKRVINVAQKELQNSSDLYFTYEEKKKGNTVFLLIFTIVRNTDLTIEDDSKIEDILFEEVIETKKNEALTTDVTAVLALIGEYGVSEELVKKWLKSHALDKIIYTVNYVIAELQAGKLIRNVAGYTIQLLEDDTFINVLKTKEIKQKEQSEKKQKLKLQKAKEVQINTDSFYIKQQYHAYCQGKIIDILRTNDSCYQDVLAKMTSSLGFMFSFDSFKSYYQNNISLDNLIQYLDINPAFNGAVVSIVEHAYKKQIHASEEALNYQKEAQKLGISLV